MWQISMLYEDALMNERDSSEKTYDHKEYTSENTVLWLIKFVPEGYHKYYCRG
jgi:hypothetical protein